ncbi:unnamed protein product [Vitrella brassicaformis CCMP3155]|uniref:Trafficking protein particle complex subunit 6B n=1 Tax=Vitrella brassicaformis (strain CCMP3155) TaxID=1169540 RepID=A0A0G4FT49_VITBC|nr:unnamed protein product [Vitrella brassicaformis CCMP3155]|eukprot:CEM17532.1 unnamed protein product [Vitrella brassicaformis CCMP3155]
MVDETVTLPQPPAEVAESPFILLCNEWIRYTSEAFMARQQQQQQQQTDSKSNPGAAADGTTDGRPVAAGAGEGSSSSSSPSSLSSADVDGVMVALEEMGFMLGGKIVERLTASRSRLQDEKDIVKFICKDLWNYLFHKQADRLQTNRRGGYVIQDNTLRWLRHMPPMPDTAPPHKRPMAPVSVICGIIRGALTHLGLSASVSASVAEPPCCSFSIKIPS